MKNIFAIMTEYGLEIPEDKKKDFEKSVLENYKTVADYDNQKDKLTSAEGKVTTLTDSLDKFKDVDLDKLTATIDTLKGDLATKDKEYADKIADRDFNDLLGESIHSTNGKNAKAITALLDIETLKASKNQKEDVAAAFKALTEAEDSKMLFGESEPNSVGIVDAIGTVKKTTSGNADDVAMRAAMGLPPVTAN